MCGIVGELSFSPHPNTVNWCAMTTLMARRGPDDEGLWNDSHCTMGFRRLAILDLSPTGHQPMRTQDGRYALVYNGEMYNFQRLRDALEQRGVRFRSSGDTEVVLYALAEWGTDALRRFNGMFALAFYDTQEKRLLIARDHAGIKPLYYMHSTHGLVFASQYDQILRHPWSHAFKVSSSALGMYLQQGYIPAPHALLENTFMLEPGTWLEINASGHRSRGTFFTFPQYQTPDLSGDAAYEAVNAAVTDAVKRQMISDVPLGTFLSGGIDSPLVAAKMRALHAGRVQAFTIGTNGDGLDESTHAARYASALGLEHNIEHVNPDQALGMLDDVITSCGEPFADYSIFPTMLVSQLARQQVTVMLSGDGGDELFWGYVGRFGSVIAKSQDFKHPFWLRSMQWGLKKVANIGNGYPNLRIESIGAWYQAKHSHLPSSVLVDSFPDVAPASLKLFEYRGWETDKTAQWMRWNEFVGHLTRVLLKVDRASMYHSLEVRVPLLDREVIETALRVDWESCLDLKASIGKIPLRRALARHVSEQTTEKRGFSVPMDQWLRGALYPVVEEKLLNRNEIAGIPFQPATVRRLFERHCSGAADYGWGLWILLSLVLWDERHFQRRATLV